MKLDSVYVVVRDIEAARVHYGALFGREPSLVDDRFSGFDLDGGLFGLLNASYFGEGVDDEPLEYGNNCVANVRVASIDALHRRAQDLQSGRATAIQDTGQYRLFQVVDADGNRVEFYEEASAS